MTSPNIDVGPKEINTRFVYPFFFDRDKADEASRALASTVTEDREGGQIAIWECSDPLPLYREELLHHVDSFLFAADTPRGCKYLRMSSAVASKWFNDLEAILIPEKTKTKVYTSSNQQSLMWPVRLVSLAGVEAFFTNYGVGLLSIALAPERVEPDLQTITLFNYKLAQLRPKVAARLRLRHPANDHAKWSSMSVDQRAKAGPIPSDDAPFRERIGVRGGTFVLGELATELLQQPLEQLGLKAFQDQFSIYTVVRFGETVDFNLLEIKKALCPFLSAITQIEEPGHAGALEDMLSVWNAILNRRHWSAVGLLGVAHIVSDQPNDHSFNDQRVPRVMTKYFVPYLASMLQRLSLQRSIREAGEFVLLKRKETAASLSNLRTQMLEFAVEGYFPEISHREILDRYYQMLQKGLGVRRAYEDVNRAIADIDKRFAGEHQSKVREAMADNVAATRKLQEETAKVQRKVSLLERFIVSVYAAELWHLVASDIDRLHRWVPHGVIAFALLGFLGAWAIEKLWKEKSN